MADQWNRDDTSSESSIESETEQVRGRADEADEFDEVAEDQDDDDIEDEEDGTF